MNFDTFDASYIEQLRCGDEVAEEHFVRYFSELILLKLRSRLRTKQAIEDVRQETFTRTLALLRSDRGVRHAERLGSLVNSICNNVLFEQYRADGRADPLEEETAAMLTEPSPDALSTVISGETRDLVRNTLNTLTERDRGLLKAIFLEEKDKDEVCREMGVTREYIRVLLHRAKHSFRKAYSGQAGGY
ncbi:sigma-70 family RNA polymerase sigma factor [Granulicella arctica]|uniref:RNA polymerase sigma-70 factor (ECF subfamily) n=1 Tax=Granulicella arctica TaxID=940613 RepID=A0A7Y9PDR4_9BACT|nr:RNA polymerase sigma-70 factor (ECF subfamily) [Granulicella arctica]